MGIVTDYLHGVVAKQVDTHGLVVWYDPEGNYRNIASTLAIPHTTVARYDGSFFALRHQIESLLEGSEPPRLVLYIPLDPAETHGALVEVEADGVTMRPGQQPPARNTRLSIIARNALKPILGEDITAAIEKQVEAGKLTLADLDTLAEKGEGITKGVVAVIFATGNPQEVALAFLTSDRHDADIIKKGVGAELAFLLQSAFEIELPGAEPTETWRARLARHVLATDLVASLSGETPPRLSTVKTASKPATRDTSTTLARTWRLRRDLRESYVAHAQRVEKELGLAQVDFRREQIVGVETFLAIEKSLQRNVEVALLEEASDNLVELAKARQSSFWSEHLPDVQAQWALIAVSGQLLREADRVVKEVASAATDAKAFFLAYVGTDRPWCLLDTYHRHLERRFHNFDFDLEGHHRSLEQLIAKARHRYMEVGSMLAERFLRLYQQAKFHIPGILRQSEIFAKQVQLKVSEGKTAYVWVDALRFEMASELARTLGAEFNVDMQAAVGTVPTITEIGMAALLPSTHESATLVSVGEGKLALRIDGTIIKDRKDRVNFLKAKAGASVFEAKLDDLLPSPKKKVREGIRDSDLVLITSQEIDALCEGDNVPLARHTMDGTLHELRRSFRILSELGVKTIVVTADHGYLFGDELGNDMKIDAPGGDMADLHRRVWVGRGGTADPSYLRARFSDFGLGGDLEIGTPWNFACFKVQGGAKAYFHGGLSPQELIVPVITLTTKKESRKSVSEIAWTLIPGSQKISTRFFSVQVKGSATSLFEFAPPKMRIEIRAKGECLSIPVSASYGFEEATGDVQLRLVENNPREIEPNTITLMIAKESTQKTATVHLLDATSGAELQRLDKIEITIAI